MEGKKLIEVRNLSKHFHKKQVLKDISLDINKGDVVCLIGPSGSGKSTFLRCLNGTKTGAMRLSTMGMGSISGGKPSCGCTSPFVYSLASFSWR